MTARLAWLAVVATMAWGGAGCAHRQRQPDELMRDFARAIESGAYERAYPLMSEGYRRQVSLAQFRADIESDRVAVVRDAAAWTGSPPAAGTAEVRARTGDVARFILTGDGWQLAEQPLAPFGQDSPRAALRTFVRALEGRRYDMVLRLVPARHRSAVTQDRLRAYWEGPGSEPRRRLIEILRANLSAPIIDLGSEAEMPYGPGIGGAGEGGASEGEVRFLLENGAWKIDDAG